MDKRIRNVLVAPVVLFVRAPLLIVLNGLWMLGERAEAAYHWLGEHLPGWSR